MKSKWDYYDMTIQNLLDDCDFELDSIETEIRNIRNTISKS